MEQAVELLQQIQEIAGVLIEAFQNAGGPEAGAEGAPPPEGEPPAEPAQ